MRKHVIWIVIVFICFLFVLQFINIPGKTEKTSTPEKPDSKAFITFPPLAKKVALINIYGEITDPREILSQLKHFTDNNSVKAIVLSIDSPGGSVGASQEIFRQINKSKRSGKIVVAAMGGTAASGAYYIAAAADRIVANPGTVTGSIGVILSFFNAEKLLDKAGIKFVTIKTGEFKDTGTFGRAPTERERAYLKALAEDLLSQFVEDVAVSRQAQIAAAYGIKTEDEAKLKNSVLKTVKDKIADGRIFTGRQALEIGLVDQMGNLDDAIERAASMAGISGRPAVMTAKKREGFISWFESGISSLKVGENSLFSAKYILQ